MKNMRPFPRTPNAPGADDAAKRLPPQSGPSAKPVKPAITSRSRREADAPVVRHSWLAKQSSADLESEFRDAADESTSLLHRPRSRFDTGQFSFRDAAQ